MKVPLWSGYASTEFQTADSTTTGSCIFTYLVVVTCYFHLIEGSDLTYSGYAETTRRGGATKSSVLPRFLSPSPEVVGWEIFLRLEQTTKGQIRYIRQHLKQQQTIAPWR